MNRETILMNEYHACQEHVSALHRQGWSLASIVFGALIVFIGFLARGEQTVFLPFWSRFGTLMALTFFVIVFLLIARRFIYFQKVCYFRMREIEQEVGARRQTYIEFLDGWKTRKSNVAWLDMAGEQREHIEKVVYPRFACKLKPGFSTENLTYVMGGLLILALWLVGMA